MPTPDELISALHQAGADYAAFIECQSDEAFHHRPAPEEWTAAEITGHVAELPVTFSTQVLRLSRQPGSPIGRSLDDPGRLAAVAKLAGAGPVEAAASVRAGIEQATTNLKAISPEGWHARGQHPRYGELTVQQLVERNIVGHVRAHFEQAQAAVASFTNR